MINWFKGNRYLDCWLTKYGERPTFNTKEILLIESNRLEYPTLFKLLRKQEFWDNYGSKPIRSVKQ